MSSQKTEGDVMPTIERSPCRYLNQPSLRCVGCLPGATNPCHPEPTRRQMIEALLIHEDLLSSRDWPWTTDSLRDAYAKLQTRDRPISEVTST